jgi:hypothetical protein
MQITQFVIDLFVVYFGSRFIFNRSKTKLTGWW